MSLTNDMLQRSMKDNKAYSGTQPFLEAIQKETEDVAPLVNSVFLQILKSKQAALMSKLLVLRLYKDIFMTGNIGFLDNIDQQVEQAIISAAAYNPTFKPKGKNDKQTRGGMYFVQTQKRPKNNQTFQLSNSFVLLATEIVKYFAAWLPQYPEGTPSRFLEIFEELSDIGVSFQTNIYFQAEEKQKFEANFKKWKNKHPQLKQSSDQKAKNTAKEQKNMKSQSQASNLKNQTQNKQIIQNVQNARLNAQKQMQQLKQIHNEQKNKLIEQFQQDIKKNVQENNKQTQLLNLRLQQVQKQNRNLSQGIKSLQKQKQKYQKQINQLLEEKKAKLNKDQNIKQQLSIQLSKVKQQMKNIEQLKNDALQKVNNMERQIQILKKENSMLRKQAEQTKYNLQSSAIQKNYENNEATHKIAELRRELQRQKAQKLKQKQQKQKQAQKKDIQMLKVVQLSKTVKQLEEVIKQNKISIYNIKVEKQKLQKQKQNLQYLVNTLSRQQKLAQNQTKQEQKKVAQKPTFIIQKQQKINNEEISKIQAIGSNQAAFRSTEKSKFFANDYHSMSFGNFLGLKSPSQQLESLSKTLTNYQNVNQTKKNSRSLHKTQTSLMNRTNSNLKEKKNDFLQTAKSSMNKSLVRKQSVNNLPSKSIITTVFSFIPQYFSPLNIQKSMHFRACCICNQARRIPFFKDDLIELKIIKSEQNHSQHKIQLINKQPYTLTIKAKSESQQLKIQQTYPSQVCAFGQIIIQTRVYITNLNFRYPIISVQIQCERKKDEIYKLPLPISLLSTLQFSQQAKKFRIFQKGNENPCKRFKSQKILINALLKNLQNVFSNLIFQRSINGNIQAVALVTTNILPDAEIKLKIMQHHSSCQFEAQFYSNSKSSQAFAKVILQILMFIFI